MHGITAQTYYRWKAKYGGMELSETQRLKQVDGCTFCLKRDGPLVITNASIGSIEPLACRSADGVGSG
jgi:hypothetical protein